jgi:hypothetical protein
MSRRGRGRRSATLLVVAAVLTVAGARALPAAEAAGPAPQTSPDVTKSATQRAADSGQPVELVEKRTEMAKTFANPDGTFTLEQSAVPVRKKRDGQWVDLNAALSRGADGVVRPAATAMDMEFSGGGTSPLAKLMQDGHELRLTWPEPLPQPVIDGDNMTYKSVYPGVDLRINVAKDTFSEVLIVHTPQAAKLPQLQKIELGIDAPGLTIRKSPGGGVEVVDEIGAIVFNAPKPAMWDSSSTGAGKSEPASADRAEDPLEGDIVASMPVEVSQNSVAVTPARSMVDAPATVYPLHIDPPYSGVRIVRSMINEHYPTTPYWGWGGDEGVGYQSYEPWSRKRLFFGFSIAKVAGADIISATFQAYETWTASCTAKIVEVWKTARPTENTNWNSGSGSTVWQQKLSHATVAYGRDGCSPGGYWVPFNVKSAVAEKAAARSTAVYLGMKAADETDELAWKRFRYDVILSVNYNFPPEVINPRTESPVTTCATSSANDPVVGDNTPQLVVSVTDPDSSLGDQAQVSYEIRRAVDVGPLWRETSAWSATGSNVPIKARTVPTLSTNTTYVWRARASDGNSTSDWSPDCYFYVDVSKPPQPTVTVVTPGPYPLNKPVTFKVTSPSSDFTGFRYTFDSFSAGSVVISKATGTVTATPTHLGPWYFRAWSVDAAGNKSDDYGEQQVAVEGLDPTGVWPMDEGTGTSTVDKSAMNRTMYLGTGATWVNGDRFDPAAPSPDMAVYLPGLQTSGATTATTATNLVDTNHNFSALVKVKLGIKSNRQVILSEDRPGLSSFSVGTTEMSWVGKDTADPADDDPNDRTVKWSFRLATNNAAGSIEIVSKPVAYDATEWAAVAAVYTAGTHEMELFVDGVSVATSSTASFPQSVAVTDGTGPFRTGLGIDGGASTHFFRGYIDDLRLYDGWVSKQIVQAHVSD